MYWEIVIPTLLWPIITIIIARKNLTNNAIAGMISLFAFFIIYLLASFIIKFNLL